MLPASLYKEWSENLYLTRKPKAASLLSSNTYCSPSGPGGGGGELAVTAGGGLGLRCGTAGGPESNCAGQLGGGGLLAGGGGNGGGLA